MIALRALGLLLVVVPFAAWWLFLRIVEHPSRPPATDAPTLVQVQAAREVFAARARRCQRYRDRYAPTTASDVRLFEVLHHETIPR